jgi:EmrB/QacA subfamily drug resistance transporter
MKHNKRTVGLLLPGEDGDEPSDREVNRVFLSLMLVMGLSAVDQSIVSAALPRILSELGDVSHLSWIVTGYVLASTTAMPLYGKLSDQYGRKPLLYTAIVVFLFGSALCGASHSFLQLVLSRAIQGLGAGGLLPLTQTIIGDLVAPARRGRRQGAISAVFAVCSALGPVLGGIITDLLSWHWIFYVNLPIGLFSFLLITRTLPRSHRRRPRRIDYIGSFLLAGCTAAFLTILATGGTEWPWASRQIAAGSAITIVLGAWFVYHAYHTPEPVLPLDLFRNRVFVVACVALSLTFMSMLGASVFFPLFFQVVMGVSASYSGFLSGPLMIGVVCSSVFNGRVLLQHGRYKPTQIAGLSLAVVAFAILAWGAATSRGLIVLEPAILALGLGLGLVTPNMTVAVQNALPAAHRGVGTATLAYFRSLGGLVGVTGSGAILARHLAVSHSLLSHDSIRTPSLVTSLPLEERIAVLAIYRDAIAVIFTSGVCIMMLALIAVLFIPEVPLRANRTST